MTEKYCPRNVLAGKKFCKPILESEVQEKKWCNRPGCSINSDCDFGFECVDDLKYKENDQIKNCDP